jgi:hypothetical protein
MYAKAIVSVVVFLALCAMFLTVIVSTCRCIEAMELFDLEGKNEVLEYLKPKRV